MATFFVRMTVYDPEIMSALESLKRSRKQAPYMVEALRQFLSSESGQNHLRTMLGALKEEITQTADNAISTVPNRSNRIELDLDDIFRK